MDQGAVFCWDCPPSGYLSQPGPLTRQPGDAPEARPMARGRRLTGRKTECHRPGRSGSSRCPPPPTPAGEEALQICRCLATCPSHLSSCISTATQRRLATGQKTRLPVPSLVPYISSWLPSAHRLPASCGDGQRAGGLHGAQSSPSHSSSWSRSTCGPGCHRRHRSCVYLQRPPREEMSVRSSHQPQTYMALRNRANVLREAVKAFSGLGFSGMGWDTFLLQGTVWG